MRGRCPGDRFRAAMAVLKQEKERMRGEWSLDSVDEWPDDGDEEEVRREASPSASAGAVGDASPQTEAPGRFVNPPSQPREVSHTPVIEP